MSILRPPLQRLHVAPFVLALAVAGGPSLMAQDFQNITPTAVPFMENPGFAGAEVDWVAQGSNRTVTFGKNGVQILQALPSADEENTTPWHVISWTFPGQTGQVNFRAEDPLPGQVHSYLGSGPHWKIARQTYRRLVAEQIWPGIDLQFDSVSSSLKYLFHVDVSANPQDISMHFDGLDALHVAEDGSLKMTSAAGVLSDPAPLAWQETTDGQRMVSVHWSVKPDKQTAQLIVGDYDSRLPLWVDPEMLIYCGFIGGTMDEESRGIGVDDAGNIYVTGLTESTNLPVLNAEQNTSGGGESDVWVAKVDPLGNLLYLTYLGGTGKELPYSLTADGSGNAYVAGGSTSSDWPSVGGGPDITGASHGSLDGFVAKLDPSGLLIYSGMFGGLEFDSIRGNTVSADGSHYVIGRSFTEDGSFPVHNGPGLSHSGGTSDIFVAKISPDGSTLEYSGFLGGDQIDYGRDIAVDDRGFAYVTGWTNSDENTFPVTVGPDLTYNGGHKKFGLEWEQYGDAFIAKILPDGTGYVYCGYIGGARTDAGFGVHIDSSGAVYLAGHTTSDNSSDPVDGLFPAKIGPSLVYGGDGVNEDLQPYGDAFVAKVSRDGTELEFCGYVGGDRSDRAWRLGRDSFGNLYLVGNTRSRQSEGFPHQSIGPQISWGGSGDGFLSMVSPDGRRILYSTYFGGSEDDLIRDVAIANDGTVYVTGWTESNLDFPLVNGPSTTHQGLKDAFVARIPPYHVLLRGGTAVDPVTEEHADVLLLDGDPGADWRREVTVVANTTLTLSIDATSWLAGQALTLYQWPADAGRRWASQTETGFAADLGHAAFPLGASTLVTSGTGSVTVSLSAGDWTLQAVITDAANPLGKSLSNAIVVHAQ